MNWSDIVHSFTRGGRTPPRYRLPTNYTYNALGQLIKKGASALHFYDDAGRVLGIYDGSGALSEEVVWLGDIPLATLRPKTGGGVDVYYIHADHLNTPKLITDAINIARWRWDAEPFGAETPNGDPSGVGTFVFNLRFPGQMLLAETGLYYNYFRDYDPMSGRYEQSDPIGIDGGLNTYAYVDNDPIGAVDPFGQGPLKIVKLCAKGYKVVKNVGFKRAVQALRRGENVLASSHKEARKVARAASSGKSPIREGRHRPEWFDHYHANPRTGGKVIYSIASALAITNYVDECDDCVRDELAEAADFFNPFSTPKDLIDIYDMATSD